MRRIRVHATPAMIAALAASLACGPAAAPDDEPAPAAGGTLRVVTWNVHDLFDEVDDPSKRDTVFTGPEVEAKLDRVGAVLARLDADVVVLQEVEGLGLLQRLALRLAEAPSQGRSYDPWLEEGFDPRGIDVGLLTRVRMTASASHLQDRAADGDRLFSRALAEVHLATSPPVVVLGAHLPSKVDPSAGPRRLRQAERMASVAGALRAAAEPPVVIAAGDLNDVADSVALAPLLGASSAMADPGAALPAAEAWTWSGDGARERIDYLLLDAADSARVARFEVASGADAAAASDHRPVVIDLWLGNLEAAHPR